MSQVARAPVALLHRRRQAGRWAKVQRPARGGLSQAAEVAPPRLQPLAARQSAAGASATLHPVLEAAQASARRVHAAIQCRRTLT